MGKYKVGDKVTVVKDSIQGSNTLKGELYYVYGLEKNDRVDTITTIKGKFQSVMCVNETDLIPWEEYTDVDKQPVFPEIAYEPEQKDKHKFPTHKELFFASRSTTKEITYDEKGGEASWARHTTLPLDSQERKSFPLYEGLLKYFPAALSKVAWVSKIGNDKHNPGEPMHHARGKSGDHADCILRHLVDMEENKGVDEHNIPQVAYIAWRALALCQEWLETNENAPLAPGAKEA